MLAISDAQNAVNREQPFNKYEEKRPSERWELGELNGLTFCSNWRRRAHNNYTVYENPARQVDKTTVIIIWVRGARDFLRKNVFGKHGHELITKREHLELPLITSNLLYQTIIS